MKFTKWLALCVVAAAIASPAMAVTPDEMLKDPQLEARARALGQDLRCVVCQNQSIDDSNAPLAHDLRMLLRERITAGDSDDKALAYLVDRYGNFVLLKPPFQLNTAILWIGPFLALLMAAVGFGWFLRQRSAPASATLPEPFTEEEQKRLDKLLNKGKAQ